MSVHFTNRLIVNFPRGSRAAAVAPAPAPEPRKKIELPPADPTALQFVRWFNYPWHSIYAKTQPGQKPQWYTSQYPLYERALWRNFQNPELLIGLRFGRTTNYAMLDIDAKSKYHPSNNPDKIKEISHALEDIGIVRLVYIRSSYSEGIHIYIFLPEEVKTINLALALKYCLEDAGFEIRGGQLEIFPNAKEYDPSKPTDYNGHRLPLQPGAGALLLDDDLCPCSDSIEKFLRWAEFSARGQDLEELNVAMSAASKRVRAKYAPAVEPIDHQAWRADWETTIGEGWTGPGQTNDLLKLIVAYGKVWERLDGESLIERAVETAINLPGYEQWCSHKNEIRTRVAHWVNSTEKNEYYSHYRSKPQRKGRYKDTFRENYPQETPQNNVVEFRNITNEERSKQAKARLLEAVAYLEFSVYLPDGVKERAKAINEASKKIFGVGISEVTLRKYPEMWHPNLFPFPRPEKEPKARKAKQKVTSCVVQIEVQEEIEKTTLNQEVAKSTTPPDVVCENHSKSETPEPRADEDYSESTTPPPSMKVCPDELSEKSGMSGEKNSRDNQHPASALSGRASQKNSMTSEEPCQGDEADGTENSDPLCPPNPFASSGSTDNQPPKDEPPTPEFFSNGLSFHRPTKPPSPKRPDCGGDLTAWYLRKRNFQVGDYAYWTKPLYRQLPGRLNREHLNYAKIVEIRCDLAYMEGWSNPVPLQELFPVDLFEPPPKPPFPSEGDLVWKMPLPERPPRWRRDKPRPAELGEKCRVLRVSKSGFAITDKGCNISPAEWMRSFFPYDSQDLE